MVPKMGVQKKSFPYSRFISNICTNICMHPYICFEKMQSNFCVKNIFLFPKFRLFIEFSDMSKIVKRKAFSIFVFIFFVLILITSINGGKNKKGKRTMENDQKLTEERKNSDGICNLSFSLTNQCEKNSHKKCSTTDAKGSTEKGEKEDDDERTLVACFVAFFKASASGNTLPTEEIVSELRLNSVLWFVRRKIVALLTFAKIFFTDDENLVGTVGEFAREWENAFGRISKENSVLKKMTICVQYKFGVYFIKLMLYYAQSFKQLAQYLKCEISFDIFRLNDDILLNCDQSEQIERIYNNFLEKIDDINGQNFDKLLDNHEDFRQFFHDEMKDMRRTKTTLYTLMKSEYVTKIEDKLPKIFRIDVLLDPSLSERFSLLMMNKSFSMIYQRESTRLTMAFLITQLRNFECLISDWKIHLSDQQQLLADWTGRAKKTVLDAYNDLASEENMCVLIEMTELAQLISLKDAQKGGEELRRISAWTDKCAEEAKRAATIEQYRKEELGQLYLAAIGRVVAYRREHFIDLLRTPGTKTRLKQLLGDSDQRMAELMVKSAMVRAFREITMTSRDILWTHYEVVLLSENAMVSFDSKLGADVSVFFCWLKAEFDQLKIGPLWDKIAQYFELEIYDPLFDQNETALKGSAQLLTRIFIRTKYFVKKMGEMGGSQKNNDGKNFQKWKQIIEGKETDKIEGREIQKHLQWMKERHKKEFQKCLRGPKLSNFLKVVDEKGVEKISQNIEAFFEAKTLGEILHKLPPNEELNEWKMMEGERGEEGGAEKERQKNKGTQMGQNVATERQNVEMVTERDGGDNLVGENEHVQCPPRNVSVEKLKEMDRLIAPLPDKAFVRETIDAFLTFLRTDEANLELNEREEDVTEVKARAMLWYINVLLGNLMAFAGECAEDFHSSGLKFALELERVKKHWKELLDGRETTLGKVLLFFEFSKFFVNNKILREHSERWQKRMISEQPIELEEAKRAEKWVKPTFEEWEAKEYFAQLNSRRDANYKGFFAISEMVGSSREVQRFFCDLSDSKTIQTIKTKIGMIVGDEYLLQLDEMFPEIMQIDVIIPLTQTALYKRLLETKTGTEQHFVWKCRIALPLLLYHLKWRIVETPTLKGQMLDVFREKLCQIQRIAFRGLRRELVEIGETKLVGEWLARSVCLLYHFFTFTLYTVALFDKAKEKADNAESVRNWHSGAICVEKEEVHKAYKDVHTFLGPNHLRYLTFYLRKNEMNLKSFVREIRGSRTRIRKLVDGEDKFMEEFRMELRDPNLFSNSRLADAYLDALFDLDKATRVVGTLSVFIAIWVRWMQYQFWTDDFLSQSPLKEKQTNRTKWAKMEMFFEDLYDGLVDAPNFDELEEMSDLLRELLRRIWVEFVWETNSSKSGQNKLLRGGRRRTEKPMVRERSANQRRHQMEKPEEGEDSGANQQRMEGMALNLGRKRTKYRIKWTYLWEQWQKIVRETQQTARGMRMLEANSEYEQWIDGMHWDTLITLLGEDGGTFRQSLKNGFKKEAKAKGRLKDFINWDMIETLMELLVSENEEEFQKGLEVIRQREAREGQEEETEEQLERKSREESALADQRMQELIREEELKKELAKRVVAERKKQKVRENEDAQRKRREREKVTVREESPSKGESARENRETEEKRKEKGANEKSKNKKKERRKNNNTGRRTPSSPEITTAEEQTTNGQREETEERRQQTPEGVPNGFNLMQFTSDDFLSSKYAEFINKPKETMCELLDIGTVINAIWNRVKIVEEMRQREAQFGEGFGEKVAKIEEEWLKLAENEILKGEKVAEDEGKMTEIWQKVHSLLKRVIFVIEGIENCEEKDKMQNELAKLTVHLHRNELPKAIISKESAAESWQTLSESGRNKVLRLIFGRKTNLASRFDELLEDWTAKLTQQRIDKSLHEQFESIFQMENSQFALNFIENSQQIYSNCDDGRPQKQMLYLFLEENKVNECGKELTTEHDEALIEEVKGIVQKWSAGSARLVLNGSFLLGVPTANSDIDLICIVPQKMSVAEEKKRFYGNKSNCNLSWPLGERFCEDDSLYCRLCKNAKVDSLLKIPFAQIPLLQFKFGTREFDLTFVIVPHIIDRLPPLADGPLNAADADSLLEAMAGQGEAYDAMRKTLSSYLDNARIIEMFGARKGPKFRQLVLWLKLWAKTNHIYGNMFGFLNGICLAVIAAKMIFWYPKSSVSFLFEKALLILLIWNWPVPIKLSYESSGEFSWDKMPGMGPLMPVITPSKLAQNAAQNVNASTFKIIKNEIKRTLSQLKLMKNLHEKGRNARQKLFPVHSFSQKYGLFVVISCVVSAAQHIEEFCGFVERRIRTSLLRFDQQMAHLVDHSHLLPDKHLTRDNECPQRVVGPQFVRTPYCKVWLVGLKLLNDENNQNWEVRKYLNERFNSEFDVTIYTEYDNIVLRGWYQNIKLTSTIVQNASQLKEWKINL